MMSEPAARNLPAEQPFVEGADRPFETSCSMAFFWGIIGPILDRLGAKRICEVGIDQGQFAMRLLDWSRKHACSYVGIDPAIDPQLIAKLRGCESQGADQTDASFYHECSLKVLPTLEACDAYFLDGDHNYFTVRSELECIGRAASASREDRAWPFVFLHDVGWPWARRDMYYAPETIPEEARHRYSAHLGLSPDKDELIEGGLAMPGRYSIGLHAGGPRNGVLTAVEDFLASDTARKWESIFIPSAYGLAILYCSTNGAINRECREHLQSLRSALEMIGPFLLTCENSRELDRERATHLTTLSTCRNLQQAYEALVVHRDRLDAEYKNLATGHDKLLAEYDKLLAEYDKLLAEYDKLLAEYRELEKAYATNSERREPHTEQRVTS